MLQVWRKRIIAAPTRAMEINVLAIPKGVARVFFRVSAAGIGVHF
jgi:hypothetical protein